MGNYRFRISNMMPNYWFHKLKDTSDKARNKMTKKQPITSSSLSSHPSEPPPPHPTKHHHEHQPAADQRKSYYFTRDLAVPDPAIPKEDSPPAKTRSPDPPRKSSKKRRPPTHKKPIHRKLAQGELDSGGRCCCRVTPESVWTESYTVSNSSDSEFLLPEPPGSGNEALNCPCKTNSSYEDILGKVDLRPIITKPAKSEECESGKWVIEEGKGALSVKVVKEDIMGISTKEQGTTTQTRSPVRRFPGGKVKVNNYSPRVGSRVRVQAINGGRRSTGNRRSLSDSTAVIKTSVDPQRDFKESMVEMIMENNMKSSKDLEDLLACYLSLNSNEYHDLIIKVFKQIWFESTHIRL